MTYELRGHILDLWKPEDLPSAEREVDPSMITCIGIGARLYNSMPQEALIARLRRFKHLNTIVLSDDWIGDATMCNVKESFKLAFPGIVFGWQSEGLVAGKHGR